MNKKTNIIVIFMVVVIVIIAVAITASMTVFSAENRCNNAIVKADKYLEEGNYSEAILLFDKAIAIDDKRADAWFNKINTCIKQEDIVSAVETSESFLSQLPDYYTDVDIEMLNNVLRDITDRIDASKQQEIMLNIKNAGWDNLGVRIYAKGLEFSSIQEYNGKIYFADNPNNKNKYLAGNNWFETNFIEDGSFAICDGYTYFCDRNFTTKHHENGNGYTETTCKFRRRLLSGGDDEILTTDILEPGSYYIYDNKIYYASEDTIYKYDLSSRETTEIISGFDISGIDSDYIYLQKTTYAVNSVIQEAYLLSMDTGESQRLDGYIEAHPINSEYIGAMLFNTDTYYENNVIIGKRDNSRNILDNYTGHKTEFWHNKFYYVSNNQVCEWNLTTGDKRWLPDDVSLGTVFDKYMIYTDYGKSDILGTFKRIYYVIDLETFEKKQYYEETVTEAQ